MSSKAWERFRIRRLAANPLALPKLTVISQATKDKLPAFLKPVIEEMERSNEQWRQNSQTTIEQAFMALKLDPGEEKTTVQQVPAAAAATPEPATVAPPTGASPQAYVYKVFTSPASTWSVNHNFGKRPHVTLLDDSGNVFIGDISLTNANRAVATFTASFTGAMICSI